MCGLCGIIWREPGVMTANQGERILSSLAPRGPDDQGAIYFGDGTFLRVDRPVDATAVKAVLLHRRLSILDLSRAGWQPMESPDGRHELVFNGEIYNYLELRDELAERGYGPFRSGGDTAVLLAAYRCWGTGVLDRLNGMFAFAVLDRQEEKIFVARDPFGIKPLYFASWRHGHAFASEIKALLQLPGVSREIDPQRAYDYLHHNVTDFGSASMFASVAQIPAGHHMTFDLKRANDLPVPVRYWHPRPNPRPEHNFEDASERVRELILEGVRLHMRSDVPVATALSGGIDSSVIACTVRHLFPDAEIHAVSYLAEDPELSEERWIRQAADRARVILHTVRATPADLLNDLDDLVRIQEEPFVSTSIYAQYCVFREARQQGIKVMLSGQGADEMFGGYKLFIAARLATLLRRGQWIRASRFVRRLQGHPVAGSAVRQFIYALGMVLPERMVTQLMGIGGRDAAPSWLEATWFDERGVRRAVHRWHAESSDVLAEMLSRARAETSLPMLLRYEDRNSMAFSVESRVPFLSRPLAEFVQSLPESFLIDEQGTTKAILRHAMRGIVPDEILDRQDKVAFATPERDWLIRLRPWVDSVLSGDEVEEIPFLRTEQLRRQWDAVLRGDRDANYKVVWRCLNLIRWMQDQQVTCR